MMVGKIKLKKFFLEDIFTQGQRIIFSRLMEIILTFRGLVFWGKKYTCPCCGWNIRTFTYGGGSFKVRNLGFCPRCNSKARHRRIWLSLKEKTNLFKDDLLLLHISPKYSLSRIFVRMKNLLYVAGDINYRPNVNIKLDLTEVPIRTESVDAIICVHVMEEIVDDRKAFKEIYRVLKPGGWALISVPTNLDQKTFEDPSITIPEERKRAFGEKNHVRIYGYDLVDRLKECGFHVHLDLNKNVDKQTKLRYGLTDNENIFYCTKIKDELSVSPPA